METDSEFPHILALHEAIGRWIKTHRSRPEDWAFARKRLRFALAEPIEKVDPPDDLVLPPEIEEQNNLILAFLELCQALSVMEQTEYYFRRYPFRNTPVSKYDHMRNTCELFFNMVYVVRERIKKTLNLTRATGAKPDIDVGAFLKLYDREFAAELKARNISTHQQRFNDVELERIWITHTIHYMDESKLKGWDAEHQVAYRSFQRQWAERARRRSKAAKRFVDAVAKGIMVHSEFLAPEHSETNRAELLSG